MNAVVDTNIFMDLAFERGEFNDSAFRFFNDTLSCKHKIFLTEAVIYELNKKNLIEKLDELILNKLRKKDKLTIVDASIEQISNANKISTQQNLPFADALIALLAKENNCVVVTRDKHFSQNLSSIIDCFKPEDLF